MEVIQIHKGDSTVFADVKKFLTFTISTELDLTGWSAKFILGYITKEFSDITSKSFEVALSAQETSQLRYGFQNGAVIIMDSEGNTKTVVNTIPFEITSKVVENEHQEIDLTIPESSGIDITLKVGADTVTAVNGLTGNVVLTAEDVGALPADTVIPDISNLAKKDEIPSIEGLATVEQLSEGLATKQDRGDYALKSDIPSLDGYAKVSGPMTEDAYNALETKNANTLYLIEEE